jgi:pilus assembly protein CpaE
MNKNNTYCVRIETRKEAVRDLFGRVITSVGGFRIEAVHSFADCDLLIMELGDHPEEDLNAVSALHSSGKSGEVFLTSESADPRIILGALRAGAREFFPQPINEQDVMAALVKFRRSRGAEGLRENRKGKIIDVIGTKGGIGATTVAVNLAVELAALPVNSTVALVDLNAPFGEVPLFLNLKPVLDWWEAARNISRLDATYLETLMIKHVSGVHVLSAPQRTSDQIKLQPGAMQNIFQLMQSMFDFILVDSGNKVEDLQKSILKISDTLFIVAGLTLPSIINLKRMLDLLGALGYPEPRAMEIIINRSGQKPGIEFEHVKEAIPGKVFWHLPHDYGTVTAAINKGEPIRTAAPGSVIAGKLAELAAAIAGAEGLMEDRTERHEQKKKRRFLFG